jgi:hypothetical protein
MLIEGVLGNFATDWQGLANVRRFRWATFALSA